MFRTPRQGYGRDPLDRLINERWPERKADRPDDVALRLFDVKRYLSARSAAFLVD